ncbi:MAG: DUF2905 domain-containing protein [Nitrospinae bacterium]|nr:DUF2905 domain-containing protein [Nitrospinota bacterium]
MSDFPGLGRALVVVGILLAAAGLLLTAGGKVPWLGRLPGDIYIKRERFSFYFPIGTSILLSVVLTLLFYLFGRR